MLTHNLKYISRFFLIVLLVLCSRLTHAANQDEERDYNVLSFRQIEASFPWHFTGNAAAFSQLQNLFPAELKIGFQGGDGDFHSVFSGNSNQSYGIQSQSFNRLGRAILHGSMDYKRSSEKTSGFINNNDSEANYPYLLADTLANGTWTREFFAMEGAISAPLSNRLDWGVGVNYSVGEASQNRDPRPDNMVVKLNVSPGLLYKIRNMRLGANLVFGYYNEDIDVVVVKDKTMVSMFQLYGPGIYNYHFSSSHYRLYRQHLAGGGMQFSTTAGKVSNLLYGKFSYARQTVDDGRKGGAATWSAVKNDARLDEADWIIADVVSLVEDKYTHQFTASFQMATKRGTEFIQRLEKINETDLEKWITYAKEQKYYSSKSASELKYTFFATDESGNMKSLLSTAIKRSVFSEEYRIPDQRQRYSNIQIQSSFLKLWGTPRYSFSVEVGCEYQFNTNKKQLLPADNFIVERIFMPEFNYLTQSYLSPGISVGWQVPVKPRFDRFFVKADFDWTLAKGGRDWKTVGFSTGLIF